MLSISYNTRFRLLVSRSYRLVGIVLLIIVPLMAYPQVTTGQKSGVQFLPGSFSGALAMARAQKKPLFVEVYLTGCPHCEALAPVLTDKQVGDFVNVNFVSWQVEANAPESKNLQRALNITYPEFPLILFVGPDGKLEHTATPAEQSNREAFVAEVLRHARTALDPALRAGNYGERFVAGERELGFLIQAGKFWTTTRDTTRLAGLNQAFGQQLTRPEDIVSPVGMYVLSHFLDDFTNPISRYYFAHLNDFRSRFPAKEVQETGEQLLYHAIYGPQANRLPVSSLVQMRQTMIALGIPPAQAAGRTLLPELDAHFRAGDPAGAISRANAYRQEVPGLGAADYAYLLHYFNQKPADSTYLHQAPTWASEGFRRLKAGKPNPQVQASLYYELAIVLQKQGQPQQALANARKGLDLARSNRIDSEPFQRLVDSLRP